MRRPERSIRFLSAAETDFQEIITYIASDNLTAAKTLAGKIERQLTRLSAHPFIGKIPNEKELADMGYRFLVIQNYLVFYTIEDHVIMIHRIIHGARDYPGLL